MTSDIKQEFRAFFKNSYRRFPGVRLPTPEPLPRGWLEESRAEVFQSSAWENVSLQTGELWSGLSGKAYKLSYGELSVVVARYDSGSILWLDDHSTDSDYQEFVRREHLLEWLPQQMDKLIHLLIATKLNFLGEPQLVDNTMEVPVLPESQKALWAGDEEVQQSWLEQEKCLADISDQIQSPVLITDQNRGFWLNFHIWTRILGKIIGVSAFFGVDNTFHYKGVQLTQFVGRYMAPR